MRVVVTGANRGIGLELVRQLLARGEVVHACARELEHANELRALATERLHLHALDVTASASVQILGNALKDTPIDVLFNVAGVYGGNRQSIEQMAPDLELPDVLNTFDVNAAGALRVSLAVLPALRRGQAKKMVHITSGMASIADNASGGFYAYRMSKAALNMMSRSLAVDLRPEGIVSVVINPGWVQTAMGGPSAPTPVRDSVAGILRQVDAATLAESGEFLEWKGGRYAW